MKFDKLPRGGVMGCGKQSANSGMLRPNIHNVEERGRLHFFYHSPSSCLPVRDILGEQGHYYKTEPYIEKRAENYCRKCNPGNIRAFLKSKEKYLFLFTRCRNKDSGHRGKLYIVGYIVKQHYELRPGGLNAVVGETKVFSFDDSYPLSPCANARHVKKKCDHKTTARILGHLKGKHNILKPCLAEVKRLQRQLPAKERRKQARESR